MSAQTVDGPKDEQPWAFERGETQGQAQSTLTWMKEMFRTDGKIHRAIAKLEELVERAAGMTTRADGSPEDYEREDEIADRVSRLIANRYSQPRYEYNEAPRGDDNSVKTVILSVGATLLVAFVTGAWILSNRVAALEARVTEWQSAMTQRQNAADQRIERLENRR